jgi:phosphoserine aminotransferase
MSSDFCSLPIETAKFDLIYAHAQKNLGPAGVTIAVVNERLLENAPDNLPTVLDYRPQIKARSIYNTPPVFAIYATLLVLRWLRYEVGGLETMKKINQRKAAHLYEALDNFPEAYIPWAHTGDRSKMNVVFHLRRPERISGFMTAAESAGLHGLEGHRSIGGLRASLYNAVTESSVLALIDFLDRQRHHLR